MVNSPSVIGFLENLGMVWTVLLLQILNMEQDGRVLTVVKGRIHCVYQVNLKICVCILNLLLFAK